MRAWRYCQEWNCCRPSQPGQRSQDFSLAARTLPGTLETFLVADQAMHGDQNKPIRDVEFPDVDLPLKEDVNRLGRLVGEMLAEQQGEAFFQQIEAIRKAAIARREQTQFAADIDQTDIDQTDIDRTGTERDDTQRDGIKREVTDHNSALLNTLVEGCSPEESERIARAFATYFQVVNTAERVHRIRRRRAYQINVGGDQPGGLHEAISHARNFGLSLEQCLDSLQKLEIEPVLTAHPTEAVRQSLLSKEAEIVRCLLSEVEGSRTPGERATDWARMRTALTAGWQTATLAPVKPGVSDEREHAMHYLLGHVYRILPVFYEVLIDGLQRKYGQELDASTAIEMPMILRFATWVGGDMDGNPNVGPETIAASLAYQRKQILQRYAQDVSELAGLLSQSDSIVAVSPAVRSLLQSYLQQAPSVAAGLNARYRDMPYRMLLKLMRARIDASLAEQEGGYRQFEELANDLLVIDQSLQQHHGMHAGGFAVRRLLWRVRTFRFYLARLDIRQDARVHRKVLWAADPELPASLDPVARIIELASGRALASAKLDDPLLARVRLVFTTLAEARSRYGAGALGLYIISMASSASDVLSVLALARAGGLIDAQEGAEFGMVPLDVAPLFETIEDLQQAPQTLRAMLADACYRAHLRARSNRQFVMLGYSDSAKDGGLLAARWALQQAQVQMLDVAAEAGVELEFFHGRGGSVSRGGGKSTTAIFAAPSGTMNGRLRVTEQGEVIHRKYGIDALALRTLAQTTAAVFTAALSRPAPDVRASQWQQQLEVLAQTSLQHYRGLVAESQDFVSYFRAATPIDVIERMSLGSRPARRGGAQIRDLRAIPWVFAWTQSRAMLPGWYGFGRALEHGVDTFGLSSMRQMAQAWPFFQSLLSDVEMLLAKSDLTIAARFSTLSGDLHAQFFPGIEQEYQRTLALLKLITERDLLANDLRLARSIRLRNPYVDPMSLMQADLLARWRVQDRPDGPLLRALISCVQGVSQALQNTG